MDMKQLLGASFDCVCGRHHTVPTRDFAYREGAFVSIPTIVRSIIKTGTCLLIADSRTYEAAGREAFNQLKSNNIETTCFIVPDPKSGSPVADDHTRDLILEKTGPADLYIAVGSGVINDLVKWTAYLRKKPYIVVATAASMNGYASANVAATINGLKVLFHAEAARAVIAEPEIIISAPFELSTAGLGDVLAKSVSSADWKVNQFLFQEYYCPFAVNLLKDLEPVYLEHPEKIKNREPDGFTALFKALFFSSIAMTITGTSSPASGGEHLVSHTLDILAGRDGQEHDLHGRQVGVSSILMAALYERLVLIEQPRFSRPPQEIDRNFWGSLSDMVEKEYGKKKTKMDQAADILSHPDNWKALKALLVPDLIPAVKLKSCLQKAGAAHCYGDIRLNHKPLERETFVAVVNHANQMRERFTILDLGVLLGIIPDETETLIEQWLAG